MFRFTVISLLAISTLLGQGSAASNLKLLYDSAKWAELSDALQHTEGPALYRGAVAVTFHQDSRVAESSLRSVIKAAPKSQEAYESYEYLTHLYLYSGQYKKVIATMEARWLAFPGRPEQDQEKAVISGFRGLPDQVTVNVTPSTLRHEDHSIFVPTLVNGKSAKFFFDTGSSTNAVSESEAKRLGLKMVGVLGSMETMTSRASGRTAVANELTIGGIRLRNVSFTVFPDNGEPWSLLPPGRRGILGIPVILAFRTLEWGQDGTVRIGDESAPLDVHRANLIFDNDHLAVRVRVDGRDVQGGLDTGAVNTDLYREFAQEFPSLVSAGTKSKVNVRGIGGAEYYESILIPNVAIEIGGTSVHLRKTAVLLSRSSRSYIGNFGMDLLEQGRSFKLDFTAMRLEIRPN